MDAQKDSSDAAKSTRKCSFPHIHRTVCLSSARDSRLLYYISLSHLLLRSPHKTGLDVVHPPYALELHCELGAVHNHGRIKHTLHHTLCSITARVVLNVELLNVVDRDIVMYSCSSSTGFDNILQPSI